MSNPSPVHQLHVGIDVSKRTLDVCLLPSEASSKAAKASHAESFTVSNDQEGLDQLLGRLAEPGMSVELVVMEATGRYERLAASSITSAGIPVAVVNPRQARDFAKAIGRLAKTDRIDAFVLARFARAVDPTPSIIPDEQAQLLQALLSRRRQILGMLVAENNRLPDFGKAASFPWKSIEIQFCYHALGVKLAVKCRNIGGSCVKAYPVTSLRLM